MKTYGIAYIATGLVFLAIDAIWLTVAAQRLYRPLMGDMLVESFRLTPGSGASAGVCSIWRRGGCSGTPAAPNGA